MVKCRLCGKKGPKAELFEDVQVAVMGLENRWLCTECLTKHQANLPPVKRSVKEWAQNTWTKHKGKILFGLGIIVAGGAVYAAGSTMKKSPIFCRDPEKNQLDGIFQFDTLDEATTKLAEISESGKKVALFDESENKEAFVVMEL